MTRNNPRKRLLLKLPESLRFRRDLSSLRPMRLRAKLWRFLKVLVSRKRISKRNAKLFLEAGECVSPLPKYFSATPKF
jgi:hypothetical protein